MIQLHNEVSKINPRLKKSLHVISMVGTYMMLFGFIFLIQQLTIGMIPFIRDLEIYGLPVPSIIFVTLTILFINKFITISSPYKE
jgi:hypothetical protein